MKERNNLIELLNYIDPASLDYTDWTRVGMALKEEGYSVSTWDEWSARDMSRYHRGECEKKWNSFNGNEAPVTGGTIYQMAVERGYVPENNNHELGWDDVITVDDQVIVDNAWIENKEITAPSAWNPVEQITTYLETLFESGENVGYVMQSYKNDKGKHVPLNKGSFDRTAGQLIEELSKCNGDIGAVLGDYDPEGGAWIRFNPLDGNGVKNENVTDFRYALVESDDIEIEKQNALIRELELPVACLVHSGKKSLHAIVKIEASDYKEYRERVNYLYDVCEKNGMSIDTQNRNPSRLSRLPGIIRGENRQFIIDVNIGKKSWAEWKEWTEAVNDNLPDAQNLAAEWDNIPELAPCLIDGILREGHKMLITGPSKAGKSFLQIELAIAIAEGNKWLGWQCKKGRVLYVNLELDHASCLNRFRDVYKCLKIAPENIASIDIWNLRGRAVPMTDLAPKLIRRANKKNYAAIIIDPIYKILTGDENSADQMAKFCNQFDKICTELNCATIYCHHHSKGVQGQKKSMDRASGSGVFARDPDALLDIIELDLTDAIITQEQNKAVAAEVRRFLKDQAITAWNWEDAISQDDWLNAKTLLNMCENNLRSYEFNVMRLSCEERARRAKKKTAWRIEGTLREFEPFEPVNVFFEYPVHKLDESGCLHDINPESDRSFRYEKKDKKKKEKSPEEIRADKISRFEIAFENVQQNGVAKMQDLAYAFGLTDNKSQTASHKLGLRFGNGSNADEDLKARFESFNIMKEDDPCVILYAAIRRKQQGGAGGAKK